jgi:hypothetical protein
MWLQENALTLKIFAFRAENIKRGLFSEEADKCLKNRIQKK